MNEVHCFLDYPFAEKLMTMKKGHCRLLKKACMVLWVLAVGLCACTERPTIDAVIQTLHERQAGQKDNETLVISLPAGSLSLTRPLVLEDAHDLIIEGSGNHETVLSGDIAVVHWKRDAARPGVLVAALPDSVDLGCASGRQHRIDLYCDGHRQQLARWPNEGFTAAGRALGSTDVGDTWIHIHGSREGIFEYVDDRIDNWTREKDAFLHGYWYWDWAEESHHIETIDTLRKSISVMKPYHDYGYRDGLRFYGYNLLCELDADGEYYIDREDRLIYWKPCADYKAGKSRTAASCTTKVGAAIMETPRFALEQIATPSATNTVPQSHMSSPDFCSFFIAGSFSGILHNKIIYAPARFVKEMCVRGRSRAARASVLRAVRYRPRAAQPGKTRFLLLLRGFFAII